MEIAGLQKLTLLDYPGLTACTVFTPGCNFRCPFCHNGSLVLAPEQEPRLPQEEIFAFLQKRKGVLQGVCVTGGEPLLQPDIADFLGKVKALGYKVKLDTNGSFPEKLQRLIQDGLVDFVAMDIKNSPAKYAATAGCSTPGMLDKVKQSATYLMEGHVPYEFRTTVVNPLHTEEDIKAIGQWLQGAAKYALQNFEDGPLVIEKGLSGFSKEQLRAMQTVAMPYFNEILVRGKNI